MKKKCNHIRLAFGGISLFLLSFSILSFVAGIFQRFAMMQSAKCILISFWLRQITWKCYLCRAHKTSGYTGEREREKESKNGWDIRKPDRNVKNVKGACMSGLNNADSLFVRINQEENVLIAPIIVVISSCHSLHHSFDSQCIQHFRNAFSIR